MRGGKLGKCEEIVKQMPDGRDDRNKIRCEAKIQVEEQEEAYKRRVRELAGNTRPSIFFATTGQSL